MISVPGKTRKIVFVDWDNIWLGALIVPAEIKDLRDYVNWFTAVNMIHPNLRPKNIKDPWAEERAQKKARAEQTWPKHEIYPEEAFYLDQKDGELVLKHSLQYLPGKRLRKARRKEGN